MKKRKLSTWLLISSSVFSLIAAIFVHAYSYLQANFIQYGCKLDMGYLPQPTMIYHQYHTLGYFLPALAVAGLFLKFKSEEKQELLRNAWASTVALGALVWLLSCVIAWQLPLYYPISVIK